MARKKTNAYYRSLKKYLNNYHKFSFNMPRKGKDFTPQQKAAITRTAKKLSKVITRTRNDQATFIPKRKGISDKSVPHSIKTNKGYFYPQGKTELVVKKIKGKKQVTLRIKMRDYTERYYKFPEDILGDMERIEDYILHLTQKYRPDYVMWAVNHFMGRRRLEIKDFHQYVSILKTDKEFGKALGDGDFNLTGVFLGFIHRKN